MKLMIDRGVLLKTLAHAQSVVERRNTIPILSNLKLEVANGKVSVAATDMEIGLTESAMADPASEDGSATAPAHTLYDIVRKLPDGAQVELALDAMAERLTVRAGRSNFQLSASDYRSPAPRQNRVCLVGETHRAPVPSMPVV